MDPKLIDEPYRTDFHPVSAAPMACAEGETHLNILGKEPHLENFSIAAIRFIRPAGVKDFFVVRANPPGTLMVVGEYMWWSGSFDEERNRKFRNGDYTMVVALG